MTFRPGDSVTIAKYGRRYRAVIVRTTPTRYLVRFTQASGRVVERWIPQEDAR